MTRLIHGIWASYADLENGVCNAKSEQTVRGYINGFRLHATILWHTVDNILIPLNMKDKFHWVLLVIYVTDRTIYVYNSIKSTVHDEFVAREVRKYAELIPTYLTIENFYEKKGLNVQEHPSYKMHSEYDPFDIVHVNNLLLQPEASMECAMYMAAFAEYLSNGYDIPVPTIDSESRRNRYAALL